MQRLMRTQAKLLKISMILCVVLESCASTEVVHKTIPTVEVCALRPTFAICRDRRKSNGEYNKRWEELIGSVCIPAMDFQVLLDAIAE